MGTNHIKSYQNVSKRVLIVKKMEKKQTAVEWLLNNLLMNGLLRLTKEQHTLYQEFKEQAKQMEKEQIEDAHIEGQRVFDEHPHTQWTTDQAEQYWNETYGTDDKIHRE